MYSLGVLAAVREWCPLLEAANPVVVGIPAVAVGIPAVAVAIPAEAVDSPAVEDNHLVAEADLTRVEARRFLVLDRISPEAVYSRRRSIIHSRSIVPA